MSSPLHSVWQRLHVNANVGCRLRLKRNASSWLERSKEHDLCSSHRRSFLAKFNFMKFCIFYLPSHIGINGVREVITLASGPCLWFMTLGLCSRKVLLHWIDQPWLEPLALVCILPDYWDCIYLLQVFTSWPSTSLWHLKPRIISKLTGPLVGNCCTYQLLLIVPLIGVITSFS